MEDPDPTNDVASASDLTVLTATSGGPTWLNGPALNDSVLHIYGKREARPGRKMGHVTRLKPLSER